ncbi:MAG: GNAT family N-acyltransferase [SAR324 cluster bacterium]|nr:GNAT family N-acyltransferase [SAR324 cluster bacterium]
MNMKQDTRNFNNLLSDLTVQRIPQNAEDKSRLFQLFSLRYEEYHQWVKPPFDKILLDKDPFDDVVDCHYGILHDNTLAACQRIILRPQPYMLEYAYDGRFSGLKIEPNSAEVSRAVVREEYRNKKVSDMFRGHTALSFLHREAYRICLEKDIEWIYFASVSNVVRLALIEGFPFETIAESTLENGDVIVVARLSWREFERKLSSKAKGLKMLEWFQS